MRVRMSGGAILLIGGMVTMGLWRMRHGGLTVEELWAAVVTWGAVAVAAALHEAGHLLTAWGMRVPVRGLSLGLLGARMTLGGMLSYGQEAVVAGAGPVVSLAVGGLLWPLLWRDAGGSFGAAVCVASLGLGVFNLLPVESMDGGRVLRCLLSCLAGERVAAGVLRGSTALVVGAVWLVAVYGMLMVGEMVAVFGFAVCLLWRLMEGESKMR